MADPPETVTYDDSVTEEGGCSGNVLFSKKPFYGNINLDVYDVLIWLSMILL